MRYFESLYPRLEFGEPILLDSLVIEPIIAIKGFDDTILEELLDIDTAFSKGLVSIKEVSTGGAVEEVLIGNHASAPLVIFEGQGLEGAKQNRVVQKTVVIPAESTIAVPVNCVERGRWRYTSNEFRPASFRAGPSVKMSKASAMKMSVGSIQSEVWREVSELSERLTSYSASEDLGEILETASRSNRVNFDHARDKSARFDGYGFKVSGGRVEFIELFGRKSWAKEALEKSLKEWLIDSERGRSPLQLPLSMLKAEWRERLAVGVETQLLADTECAGIAAEYKGALLHLFCAPEKRSMRPRPRSYRRDLFDIDE